MKSNGQKRVLIVGGGPAGAMSALLLSQLGFDITLLEKRTAAFRKVCGEYLCPPGVSLLQSYQCEDLLQDYLPLLGMKIYAPSGQEVKALFPDQTKGLSLNRQLFDEQLRQKARVMGVKILMGESVREISSHLQVWKIKTETLELEADILVGADGINSTVARQLQQIKPQPPEKKLVLHTVVDLPTTERMGEMHLLSHGRYVGINPVRAGEVNYSLFLETELVRDNGVEGAVAFMHKIYPHMEEKFPQKKMDTIHALFPLTFHPKNIAGVGWCLVGDASGFVDPLTGEGIYNALYSAHLLFESFRDEHKPQQALRIYANKRKKNLKNKEMLNRFFQHLIKHENACDLVARALQEPKRAQAFMGIIGNVYSPFSGLRKMTGF